VFKLPSDISFHKEQLDNGIAFIFRHAELGELGRLLLQERSDGQTQVSWEVVGDPRDPMTKQRAAIFEPIGRELSEQLEQAVGGSSATASRTDAHVPKPPPPSPKQVASKLIPCPRCGRPAALLIFADYAENQGGLEDYARLMYPQVVELNVPTWVIGPPEGQSADAAAGILKIWPEREPLGRLTPEQFNQGLDRTIAKHCR
jgi:hypothetical protein